MVKSILHLILKSIYELTRQSRILYPKLYNQFQADMYYLYVSSVFLVFYLFSGNFQPDFDQSSLLYKEDLHNLSGLFNEIMSSAQARIVLEKASDQEATDERDHRHPQSKVSGLEESTMLTICEVNLQKLLA